MEICNFQSFHQLCMWREGGCSSFPVTHSSWFAFFFVEITDISSVDSGRPDTPETDESEVSFPMVFNYLFKNCLQFVTTDVK